MRNKLNLPQIALLNSLVRALFASTITLFLLLASSSYASNIAAITVAPMDIPFLLDDEGQVWAFKKPMSLEEPIKLPNLNHIKKIAPYIAVDTNGQVFTWSLNPIKTDWGPDGLNEAVYNTPQRVGDLQGVTLVASSGGAYFVAVIGNKNIVDWLAIIDKSGTATNGPIRSVSSRSGVKAVAAYWSPEVISREEVVIAPSASSLVALFDDGDVIGWGTKPTGVATRDADRKGVLLTRSPGAIEVSMNAMHTVILSANGVPQFWGGCDGYRDGKGSNGHQWSSGSIEVVEGTVVDVIGMSLFPGYDNVKPNVFIKRDGAVWAAYAPAPPGMLGKNCYLLAGAGDKRQSWQLPAGKAAAVQVAMGGSIFMLDAEHKLWTTANSWMNTKLHNVLVNLK